MMLTIFLIALLSFLSYLYCWYDVKKGRPHIVSLRQVTLIMDRRVLNKYFGEPDERFHYVLPLPTLLAFVRVRRNYIYLEMMADALCMLGAWRYMTGSAPMALEEPFLLLAGLCQGVNFAYSMWLVWKWGDQIREEMGE